MYLSNSCQASLLGNLQPAIANFAVRGFNSPAQRLAFATATAATATSCGRAALCTPATGALPSAIAVCPGVSACAVATHGAGFRPGCRLLPVAAVCIGRASGWPIRIRARIATGAIAGVRAVGVVEVVVTISAVDVVAIPAAGVVAVAAIHVIPVTGIDVDGVAADIRITVT